MEPTIQAYLVGILSGLLLFAGVVVLFTNLKGGRQ